VQTGQIRQRFTGFRDRVTALDFSRDGKYLATGGGAPTEDGELRLIELPSGKIVFDKRDAHSDTIFGVRFSPDGKLLASCGADKFVKVWEVPSGKFVKSFEGHTHHVMDVGWKGDGKLLASCSADNTVKVWDYEKANRCVPFKLTANRPRAWRSSPTERNSLPSAVKVRRKCGTLTTADKFALSPPETISSTQWPSVLMAPSLPSVDRTVSSASSTARTVSLSENSVPPILSPPNREALSSGREQEISFRGAAAIPQHKPQGAY
jgi:WD40 repeat protein